MDGDIPLVAIWKIALGQVEEREGEEEEGERGRGGGGPEIT